MGQLGGLSRHRRGRPLNAEVNIINLVDVMLVLLIIFMVTAPILQGGIKVDLPKLDAAPVAVQDPLIITVEKNGNVSINETHYSQQQLPIQFARLAQIKHAGGVIIQADGSARVTDLLHVLDLARSNGLDKASIATQPAVTP